MKIDYRARAKPMFTSQIMLNDLDKMRERGTVRDHHTRIKENARVRYHSNEDHKIKQKLYARKRRAAKSLSCTEPDTP